MSERNEIFISHKVADASVSVMIKDFLTGNGIPDGRIFCSSIPGNDVNEHIDPEVKDHLKKASIIILLLSRDFYKSAYCLNEAGVAWYLDDVLAIPIGLPEVNHDNMRGFINSSYILRRLNDDSDLAYLCEKACERLDVKVSAQSLVQETKKIKAKYQAFFDTRESELEDDEFESDNMYDEDDIWTDGFHEVQNSHGVVIKKGTFENGHLIDGIEFNSVLKIVKGPSKGDFVEDENEKPATFEDIKLGDFHFSYYGRYEGYFRLMLAYSEIEECGLEFFYVADKKVKMEGKQIIPTYTNFRTLESVLAEFEPDTLDEIKTGVLKYEESRSAYFDLEE